MFAEQAAHLRGEVDDVRGLVLVEVAGSVESPSLLLRYTHSALFSASITSRMAEPTRPVPPVTTVTLPMVNGGAERESLNALWLVQHDSARAICVRTCAGTRATLGPNVDTHFLRGRGRMRAARCPAASYFRT